MSAAYLHVSALQATCEQWQQFTWRRNSEVTTSNAFVKVIFPLFFCPSTHSGFFAWCFCCWCFQNRYSFVCSLVTQFKILNCGCQTIDVHEITLTDVWETGRPSFQKKGNPSVWELFFSSNKFLFISSSRATCPENNTRLKRKQNLPFS